MLREVSRRVNELAVLYVEIGEKHHLKAVPEFGVFVHHFRHRIDELDDQLGHEIAGRRLTPEDKGAGSEILLWVTFQAINQSDEVQPVQMLPFVFVNALYLNVEETCRIDRDPGPLLDNSRQSLFIRKLHPAPIPVEFWIFSEILQAPELDTAALAVIMSSL